MHTVGREISEIGEAQGFVDISPIQGTGEMANLVRRFPWQKTAIGPISGWRPELLVMVNMMLVSKVPTTVLWGPDMLVFYNDAFVPFLSGKHPEGLGLYFRDLWTEAYDQVAAIFTAPFQTGEAFNIPTSRVDILLDGELTRRYFSYAGNPIWGETPDGPRVLGLYQTATDNSEAVLTAEKLKGSEQQARRVLQSIGDAVMVTDTNETITGLNLVAEHLTGWTEQEAIGLPLSQVFNIIDEVTREPVVSPADKVKTSGAVEGLKNHTILLAKDGRETHIANSSAPIYDENVELAGIVLVFRDIGERRAAEKQRDALSQELSQVLDVTRDAVLSIDRNWRITYMNPNAKRAAGPLGEIGRNFWKCFPDTVCQGSPYVENYYRAMDEGLPGAFEAFYPAPLEIWVAVTVRPTDSGITLFFSDITEAKRMTAALLQNEKLAAVGRLASSIAHEINNPLESITNLLYLASTTDSLAEVRSYLKSAETELQRTSAITSQTLRFHKQASRPTSVTCQDLLSTVLEMHQARISNSHVHVEKRKRAHAPVLCFDGEIRQVLSNLVGNAIDAMHGSGGRLLLRSREGTDWRSRRKGLIITVADTGAGMSQATLQKAFAAFFTTKGMNGTGLGLWISKEILDRHHGRMLLRSSQRPTYTGTVFSIFLPFDAIER